jgi:4-diphosphocytidyl-2-C-methyl-D-erythritol kinase
MALNRLWSLGWPKERLMAAAARLGSDVPFFVAGGPAVIRGRGERVEPARLTWHGWIVLMLPAVAVSTAEVYRAWRAEEAAAAEPGGSIENGAVPPAVGWMNRAYNMLERPALAVCPALGGLMARAAELLGRPVRMSGSGSALFTAYDTEIEARQWSEKLSRELQLRTYVVQPVEHT